MVNTSFAPYSKPQIRSTHITNMQQWGHHHHDPTWRWAALENMKNPTPIRCLLHRLKQPTLLFFPIKLRIELFGGLFMFWKLVKKTLAFKTTPCTASAAMETSFLKRDSQYPPLPAAMSSTLSNLQSTSNSLISGGKSSPLSSHKASLY